MVQGEVRRKIGSRFSTLTCHEWILVAQPAASGNGILEPMWVNLRSGRRSLEFPKLGDQLRDSLYSRANGWSDHQRDVKALYEQTTLRQAVGDLPPADVLRKRSRAARGAALAQRPLTMLEVLKDEGTGKFMIYEKEHTKADGEKVVVKEIHVAPSFVHQV